MDSSTRAIAVVGLGALLPDAPDVAALWRNVTAGRYSITDVPAERWNAADYYDPDPAAPDKTYSKIGGWVRGFAFDWKQHKLPPRVAAAMDQGQQWAVTVAAQALADYGYPARPLDTERTAVVLGTAMGGELHYLTHLRVAFPEFARALEAAEAFSELPAEVRRAIRAQWQQRLGQAIPPITEDSMPGELPNIVAGRVANVFNLRGPSFITDAACASALAAVDAAVELLSTGKAEAVLTGGVDRNMGASTFVKFCKIGALSATGTRPFGDGADGFVMGEGAAAFLLKRLADAERAGDRIYAVIRGVGGSSDGKGKGITAPNPAGQRLAISRAWESAGLDPASAALVEAHGTSTRVGDVVEVESLAAVFAAAAPGSIGLGSVKSNIGHLKAGAGAAGLLKAVLAVHHQLLPPTLNARRPNPNIDFPRTPFALLHEAREWRRANGAPRRAGVSAYGFGGTNFHVVLEEHVPGALTREARVFAGAAGERPAVIPPQVTPALRPADPPARPAPLRGLLALGAATPAELQAQLAAALARAEQGWAPPPAVPAPEVLRQPERLVIDFGDAAELRDRLRRAQKTLAQEAAPAWKALQAQGVFRGRGAPAGRLAFLFPGQGSQYLNMGRALAAAAPAVAAVFAEADQVMTPILGRPLSHYLFPETTDPAELKTAEQELQQTALTQPAMLAFDIALYRLLAEYGFAPDVVMGHSLGEYAALIAAGVMPFADALEAAAARGAEMTKVSVGDNGWMAAVMAPADVIESTLAEVPGYVVAANLNSFSQSVIGGESAAVAQAIELFLQRGYQALRLPVSHAFHTRIVAPASGPLRQVLDRLRIAPPRRPLVANVTGELYPTDVDAIKDLLQRQIASPVQWVKGTQTLYAFGARTFVEVGPKKALKGLVDDILARHPEVLALFTNHPKTGELASFNQALCGLYAAGYGVSGNQELGTAEAHVPAEDHRPAEGVNMPEIKTISTPGNGPLALDHLGQALAQALSQAIAQSPIANHQAQSGYDRNAPPPGSIVITGTGLGLPGAEKPVMDPDNALRLLRGEQFVDLIPERFRQRILAKRLTRLVKGEDGSGRFEVITDQDEVIKLAGRPGPFDLAEEYGVPAKLVEALDLTTQLAMAAGLDALREAGLPLVLTWKRTSTGKLLPDRWLLPEAVRDETGVIFASAFPGGDRFADEFSRYYAYQNRLSQVTALEDLRRYTADPGTLRELDRRLADLREQLAREPYEFDRRFLFRILSMGHSQFAEYVGARGPNTQVNAACASTAQAIALAEDWIRAGRCRRVLVIGADAVTSDNLMEWVGAGFLATGAAATDDRVAEAALPFDRRRHGTLIGMGACALVVESEDAARERGVRGLVELLSSETSNSAFHGTRLDVQHIAQVMNRLVSAAERRFGLDRQAIAPQLVFISHETFTPARGGSAAAEVVALRETFGPAASEIVIANTKGFTGHPMGVGVEDVIAVKILEHGLVPPVPNFKEVDPDLGVLNLSRGGRYPVQYALHLAAGFGSQISLTLMRRLPGAPERVDQPRYRRWLAAVSGCAAPVTEVVKRVLRLKAEAPPQHPPEPSAWQAGTGPVVRAAWTTAASADQPARLALPAVDEKPIAVDWPIAPAPEPVQPVVVVTAPALDPVTTNGGQRTADDRQPALESAPAQPSSAVNGPSSSPRDLVAERVLAIVAEKTGYPPDMLDLDLDMEADLGIDTVKQAETFTAIREAYAIPRRDDLKLRDYPTLRRAIQFVYDARPELKTTDGEPPTTEKAPDNVPVVSPGGAGPSSDPVAERVLAIVAEKTGYPPDMLDLDLDMEADLGIDTVKQAETFTAIREAYAIPRRDDLKLRDYPTLRRAIQFVYDARPELAVKDEGRRPAAEPAPAVAAPARPSLPAAPAAADPVAERVLAIVAEKTGYPPDMLDLDLDMEADLGIDTVKQAETFAAIRAAYAIPRRDDLKLRDYPTLRHVIGFVHDSRPALPSPDTASPAPEPAASVSRPPSAWSLAAADKFPRRVPVPALRPPLALCQPTGVTVAAGSRVVVMADQGGVGAALASRLAVRGAEALLIDQPLAAEALEAQLQGWLAAGPLQGVYWLPALDVEPDLETLDLAAWRELNRLRVKNLYRTMRQLYAAVAEPGTFLVSGTRLGGLHGYGPDGATAPLGGAVAGFTKAYKRERPAATVKVVDFAPAAEAGRVAEALLAETLADPGLVEVGYQDGLRFGITLTEQPAPAGGPGQTLTPETVFAVTGAAGGITSAIVADLAAASGGTFYLLDLAPAPDPASPEIALFRADKDALKARLIEAAKAAGERPTPALIDKRLLSVERAEAALRAIEAVQAAGGTAHYRSLNLLEGPAVAAVIDEIRARHGRLDVLVHAGGLEISRALPDKDPAQFDLVFDVKADGLFNLLRAARGLPLGATVAFSSVAGRFGNAGQTDYSAANDLLCKVTSSLRRWRPATQGLVIDWTAWGGIGMATRGSIPKIMEAAGIDLLPPESGVPTVRRELTAGGFRGEVVVGGRLGMMVEEFAPAGGLDLKRANAWLAAQQPPYLMAGRVTGAALYGGLSVETTLDPNVQPFLYDHALEGTPLLPGVMGVEAFAELAGLLAPGFHVAAVEAVQFQKPFKFFRRQSQTLHLSVSVHPAADGELVAQTALRSITPPPKTGLPTQERLHFTGQVRLARSASAAPAPLSRPALAGGGARVDRDAIYRVYFHGPAYQVLDWAVVAGEQAVGAFTADLPPNTAPAEAQALMAPRLVELCFQTAGLWEMKTKGVLALPLALRAVRAYPSAAAAGPLQAVVTAHAGGAEFSAVVLDAAGRVLVELEGYRTIALPGSVAL